MAYRKKNGSDTWHWCSNCTRYPTADYTTAPSKPSSGELCNECKAKQAAGQCRG